MQASMDLGRSTSAPSSGAIVSTITLAKHLDLSQRTIHDLRARGIIGFVTPGRWDLDACRVDYIRHIQARASGRAQEGDLDLSQEKAKLARAQTEKTELEVRVRRGELLEAAAVLRRLTEVVVSIRSRILGMSSKLAPRLGAADAETCERLIHEEAHDALSQLASWGTPPGDQPGGTPESGPGHRRRARKIRPTPEANGQPVGRKAPRSRKTKS